MSLIAIESPLTPEDWCCPLNGQTLIPNRVSLLHGYGEPAGKFSANMSNYEVWKPVAYASSQWQRQSVDTHKLRKKPLPWSRNVKHLKTTSWERRFSWKQTTSLSVPLLEKTHLDCLPPRILHFCLRLMRFSYAIMSKSKPKPAQHLQESLEL